MKPEVLVVALALPLLRVWASPTETADTGGDRALLRGAGSNHQVQQDRALEERVIATADEIEQEQEWIKKASRREVDPEKWEFIGKRSMLALDKPRINYDAYYDKEDDESVYEEGEREELKSPTGKGDQAILGLPDGRIFRQKVRPIRRSEINGTLTSRAVMDPVMNPATDSKGSCESEERDHELSPKQVVDSDNRSRSVSSSKPGVMVRIQSSQSSDWGSCSGSMISPRVILTAAHCLTDDDGDWDYGPTYIVPATRGASYTPARERKPQGARRVEEFVKPGGWKGSGAKYDYALLVIEDLPPDNTGSIQWNPRPVFFGSQTSSWLESKRFNLFGYPGGSQSCADAASGDGGKCNGYAYYEDPAKKIYNAHLTWLSHKHDTLPGQSGAPIYYYANDERIIYAVHKGEYSSRNRAHRIRSGSFDLMCDVIEDYPSSYFPNFYCD